jgi:hypothetical protein
MAGVDDIRWPSCGVGVEVAAVLVLVLVVLVGVATAGGLLRRSCNSWVKT